MPTLLTVNAGSSSVRLAAFATPALERVAEAHHAKHGDEPPAARLARFLAMPAVGEVRAVAHRVVHGGARFTAPARIDAGVEAEIARLAELAPLHNPRALAWIRASREALGPEVAQLAVFDTAFHAAMPAAAATYALPRALAERLGLRRYGFHGLAHEAMWNAWAEARGAPEGRVISLQLGAGCSIAAVRDGRSLDTSMGFSPLEGLVMATRSGDVDPGLLLHLQRVEGLSPEALERLLNEDSGLKGLGGEGGDMRALLASQEEGARLAVEAYCYRARKYVGAFLAVLGGADAVVFGGGVGENSPAIRARILEGLEWAGIALDANRNRAARGGGGRIDAGGGVEVRVVGVDEAALIARKALAAISPA